MNMFAFEFNEVKCGCCNWEVTHLYVLANSKKEARRLLKDGDAGLCGSCMCDLLTEEKYEIELSRKKRGGWEKLIGNESGQRR